MSVRPLQVLQITEMSQGRRGRDGIVVGFTTTCAISAYYH